MMMLSKDEFDGVMRKNLLCLIIASLNFTHVKCTHDEENHSYLITGLPHGWDISNIAVYKFIYHLRRVTTAELDYVAIDQISDGIYNPIIKWNEELKQYDLCNRESDIPYTIIHTLAFAMNDRERIAHNSKNHQNPKEEKAMPRIKVPAMKQKKKVYPNIFDHRLPGIAGIKDIQIHEKNGDTITTVIWSDKDGKGRNKVTVVSCCATEHPNTETGIAMAIAKRYFGGRNVFKRVTDEANILNNKRFQQSRHRASVKRTKKGEINDSQ